MEKMAIRDGVLLRRDRKTVLYDARSMDVFSIDIAASDLPLDEVLRSLPAPGADGDSPPPRDASLFAGRDAIIPIMLGEDLSRRAGIKPPVGRLTLNISNACNLWCSYCYADHGHYHAERSLLAPAVAEQIVDRIMSMYSGAAIVHFFGGEPLMNLKAIDAVGKRIELLRAANPALRRPNYVATTNGTISSKRVIETLKRWQIELTVSWDGPKVVQDKGRPMLGDASSYDKLVRSLEKFRQADIPYSIECTYNAAHYNSGLTIAGLMDFFWSATGQRVVHIAPASTPVPGRRGGTATQQVFMLATEEEQQLFVPLEKLIPLYREAARITVANFLSGEGPMLDFAHRVIEQLILKRRSQNYCPAFFDQLSISADGTAYPCFMFIGDPKFNLGNVLTDTFPTKNGTEVFRRYFEEFGRDPVGTNQWFKDLYGGCVAGDFISTSSFSHRYLEPLHEAIIEECLFGLASSGHEAGGETLIQ